MRVSDSSALHCELSSSGTRCSICKPMVLVTLGGCHVMAWWCDLRRNMQGSLCGAPEKFVRGIVLTSREPQRATLVERVIELPSLSG